MIVTCICGSPKGAKSVTMQYANYLQLKYPEHSFNFIHAAQYIERFERNTEYFEKALEKIKQAELVLWVFPLYILNVHSGLKRFIELVFERHRESHKSLALDLYDSFLLTYEINIIFSTK